MFKNKAIIIGLFSFLMIFSFIPVSQAELWELIIELDVKGDIHSGETVVVSGKVVDHAYKPISEAEVFIRAGSDTTLAFTDQYGVFTGEFKDFQRIPGTYAVNVIASLNGMTGLSSSQFQVNGDVSKVSILEEKLSTDEARKYLYANESDFEKNPIGQTLFRYYQGLFEELIIEEEEYRELADEQMYLEEQRIIAENLRNKAIDESNLGNGTYGGYQYDDYINSLNPEIKDLIASQLNFTKNTFEDAQKLRDEIIANGGTYEEARQVYLDMISIPKEVLEQFNQEILDKQLEDSEN
ncbi:MAG TPA: carboxypeptidase-like regulatory domain-containing protein [Nitrosopumilus sp.]|nr:carboxypeptidase-like regulatory domain-containing protein [Thermoproteota archaeon]HJJ23124.1 carboxypeptidase-like regulatory domain-containing protein [Nitrosopumilus sp.]